MAIPTKLATAGVFLDRDGVIIQDVDLLYRPSQIALIAGAAEGIRLLNESGRKVVIVTNQSVVARGMATPREIVRIHRCLRAKLAEAGARVDAILYCPYHEDANLPLYRRASPDRKPAPGMLLKGARRFGLDLSQSFMIGDQTGDMEAGRRAGCRTVLVRTGYAGRDGKYAAQPDYVCNDLLEAASLLIRSAEA